MNDLAASVIRVGNGRGVRRCYVVTAAHCLQKRVENDELVGALPPVLSDLGQRTYTRFIGPRNEEPTIAAECLFADPVGDIAVLGCPDGQALFDEAESYVKFTSLLPRDHGGRSGVDSHVRTSRAGLRRRSPDEFGGFATPERSIFFDINDFDETLPAPWEWDVKRLAASIVIAAHHINLPPSAARVTGTLRLEFPTALPQCIPRSATSHFNRSQNRYKYLKQLARPERLELPTLGFEDRYSIQLSYGRLRRAP